MAKNYFKLLTGLFLCFILLTACNKDPFNGELDDLTGVFSCQESSTHSGLRKYLVEFDPVANSPDQYIISNFHNQGDNEFIYADYHNDTLWIINQLSGDLRINGKGPVDPDFRTVRLYYEIDDGLNIFDFQVLYER
jgi:hypothetical protein